MPGPAHGELLLATRGIVKRFPGVTALDRVDFEVRRGEVHGLVGENGAGKSTLMNILSGSLSPDAGEIELWGEAMRFANPRQALLAGIGVVFQELSLAPNLDIAENIFANRQPTGRFNFINRPALNEETRQLLARFQLPRPPTTPVKRLPVAEQQVVEILKALSHRPRLLILDEPTSSLTSRETRLLFENIRQLKGEGLSFIYISHHLPEIFEIADRVTVLRDGRHVATLAVGETSEEQLVRLMVGRDLGNMYGRREQPVGEPYFHVRHASRSPAFREVSFSLARGEILGLAGLVGAGRSELGRALFGLEPLETGEIELEGARLRICGADAAIRHGIGYLTEDRKQQGLFLRMSLSDNAVAPSLSRFARRLGFMDDFSVRAFAEECRRRFNIITPSVQRRVAQLSGGNQQKVLLSAWMGISPRVLFVDEPTRGVDVGARADIYRLLRQLAARGVGILLISSDLLEILGLSDRILVMRAGRLAAEFTRAEASEEKIIAAATGVAERHGR